MEHEVFGPGQSLEYKNYFLYIWEYPEQELRTWGHEINNFGRPDLCLEDFLKK